MIHAFSDPAPMQSVSEMPSVQTHRTAALVDAVMYSCDETTACSLRRWRRSSERPTSDGSTPSFWSMVWDARPPSKKMRVGGSSYIPAPSNGGIGGGGGLGTPV
jgi:hypothetical protein